MKTKNSPIPALHGPPSQAMVVISSSLPMKPTPVDELPFRKLADEWTTETSGFPRIKDRIKHSAYRKIIGWRHEAIPYILAELKKDPPDHWFEALYQITHNDPTKPEDHGDVQRMADAWLKWGRRRGWTS